MKDTRARAASATMAASHRRTTDPLGTARPHGGLPVGGVAREWRRSWVMATRHAIWAILAMLLACDSSDAPPDAAEEPVTADVAGAPEGPDASDGPPTTTDTMEGPEAIDEAQATDTMDGPDPPDAPAAPGHPDDGDWTAGIVDVPATGDAPGLRTLTDLRWASHPAYERVTFEFEEATVPAFHLEYIDRPVRRCGSGETTPIAGDGWLEVRLHGTAAHTDAGEPTITEREAYPELEILREVEITCDFEGEVVVVLGVGSPNRFRAQVLEEPARLAVDIRR